MYKEDKRMVNYKSKFVLNYVIFMIAIGVLMSIAVNVVTAVLFETVMSESGDWVQFVVKNLLNTLVSVLVMYLGVGSASKYASKGEDVPEYADMKKFTVIFFCILALVQVIYSGVNIMNYVNEINEFIDGVLVNKEKYQVYSNKVVITYIVSTVVLVVGQLLMIPVTLKKYDE